jgi:hypothetical protein
MRQQSASTSLNGHDSAPSLRCSCNTSKDEAIIRKRLALIAALSLAINITGLLVALGFGKPKDPRFV